MSIQQMREARRRDDTQQTVTEFRMKDPVRERKRSLLYLAVTLLIGTMLICSIEIGLAWFGLGDANLLPDPFVGFRSTRPLFALCAEGSEYEIAPSRRTFFNYDSFASTKADNEFRIFCLGGSTVAGNPYGIETSFTTWLELGLTAADPNRSWQVVNCGGISYASYRLVPVLEEVLAYSPDLIVLLSGHNEFLEDRSYGHIRRLPGVIAVPYDWISRTRIFTVLRGALPTQSASESARTTLPTEVRAMLDFRGGLEKYRRDDAWRTGVIEHYVLNLERMVGIAQEAGIPFLLVNPGCNLRDIPPFKSEHREGLTDAQKMEWTSLRKEADEFFVSEPLRSVECLYKAIEIDDQHAGTYFRLGQAFDSTGRFEEALQVYEKAKELDICPLRVLEPMNRAVVSIAKREDLPFVDARSLLAKKSRDGIPGDDVYLDHVHPTIEGHQSIADAVLQEMVRLGLVQPSGDWKERRDSACAAHLKSLDDVYFGKGSIRLEKLRAWAAGLSDIESPPETDLEASKQK